MSCSFWLKYRNPDTLRSGKRPSFEIGTQTRSDRSTSNTWWKSTATIGPSIRLNVSVASSNRSWPPRICSTKILTEGPTSTPKGRITGWTEAGGGAVDDQDDGFWAGRWRSKGLQGPTRSSLTVELRPWNQPLHFCCSSTQIAFVINLSQVNDARRMIRNRSFDGFSSFFTWNFGVGILSNPIRWRVQWTRLSACVHHRHLLNRNSQPLRFVSVKSFPLITWLASPDRPGTSRAVALLEGFQGDTPTTTKTQDESPWIVSQRIRTYNTWVSKVVYKWSTGLMTNRIGQSSQNNIKTLLFTWVKYSSSQVLRWPTERKVKGL